MEENNKNRKHRRASKVIFVLAAALAFLLVLAMVTSVFLLIFPVKEIEVEGDSRYAYSEIIESSGVRKGARLYFVNSKKAEERILKAHPYLERVEVDSLFPGRVKISIKEFDTVYLIKHERGFCYVNGDYEILEIVDEAPAYDEFSGICIKLESSISGEIGDVYSGEDAERADALIEYIKQYGFYTYLNIVDVERKYDNSFVVGKRYKFILGSMVDVGEKIDASFKVVLSDGFQRDKNCIIDTTDKKKVISRYVSDEKIAQEFDFCKK
jgi:hypothetical protein